MPLVAYAEILAHQSGQPISEFTKLITPMLARSMATDRAFARSRRLKSQVIDNEPVFTHQRQMFGSLNLVAGRAINRQRPVGVCPLDTSKNTSKTIGCTQCFTISVRIRFGLSLRDQELFSSIPCEPPRP
jgi:uncharacterized protein DUF2274